FPNAGMFCHCVAIRETDPITSRKIPALGRRLRPTSSSRSSDFLSFCVAGAFAGAGSTPTSLKDGAASAATDAAGLGSSTADGGGAGVLLVARTGAVGGTRRGIGGVAVGTDLGESTGFETTAGCIGAGDGGAGLGASSARLAAAA